MFLSDTFIVISASFLFLTPTGKKLSGEWVNKLLRSLCTVAGVKKNITAHCMRHSFATNLWQNGADLVEIKELLNHTSIAATRNYVHLLPPSNLREMVDQGPLDIFTTYRQKNPLLVKTL